MASCGRQLRHLLECQVCMEIMNMNNKPKMLPCQHTVCELCVVKLKPRKCPTCRLPFGPPKQLPNNLTILHLTDDIQPMNQNSVGAQQQCMFCVHIANVVSHYCENCNDNFCDVCVKKHQGNTLYKEHTLVKITTKATLCKIHNRAFTIYCLDCNTLLCSICVHQDRCCTSNNKKALEDLRPEKSRDLERLIDIISSEIQKNTLNIQSVKNTIKSKLDNIEHERHQIKTQTETLRARLKQREDTLLDELDQYEKDLQTVEKDLPDKEHLKTLLEIKKTAEAAREGGIEQILMSLPPLQAMMPSVMVRLPLIKSISSQMVFAAEDSINIGRLQRVGTLADDLSRDKESRCHFFV